MEHWYAVYVKSRREKKAVMLLEEAGTSCYLPLVRRRRRWKDRKIEVDMPLFPAYVFVRLDFEREEAFDRKVDILRTPGVVKMVGTRDPMLPILHVPDQEIWNVKTVLERNMKVDPYKYSVSVGQTVRIKSGPLTGVEGVVVERRGVYRLILHVRLIQQAVAVEIHPGDVEA